MRFVVVLINYVNGDEVRDYIESFEADNPDHLDLLQETVNRCMIHAAFYIAQNMNVYPQIKIETMR